MSPAKLPVAILGATGYVGQHFARLLADHPWFEVVGLCAADRSVGQRLGDRWRLAEEPVPPNLTRMRVEPLRPSALLRAGVRAVFSALPSGTAGPVETGLARRGLWVFSNAADHRLDPLVPLLVPEVNPTHLRLLGQPRALPIVANPNCTTTGLVLPLAALDPVLGLARVHVASYQALSGAGWPGLSAGAAHDNVVPFIDQEEEKLARESPKLLGRLQRGRVRPRPLPVLAHCARVGVRDGHLEAVTIRARHRPSLSEVVEALRAFAPLRRRRLPTAPERPIVVRTEPDRPQPTRDVWAGTPHRARGMAVSVGRLRWDPPFLRMFVLSHNAVRGGAGGSVLNAELAAAEGRLPGGEP